MSYDNCFYDAGGNLVCGFKDCNWQPWSGLAPTPNYTVKCEQQNKKFVPPQVSQPNPIPYMQKYPNQNLDGRYKECFTNVCGQRDNNFPKGTLTPPYTVSDLLKEDGQGLVYLN